MFADGFSGQRMYGFRRNFTERLQDEATFRQMGMGNDKILFVNNSVTEEQKVQIDYTWSLIDRPDPPERIIFNLKHSLQKDAGIKPCRESEYRVVKSILCYCTDR